MTRNQPIGSVTSRLLCRLPSSDFQPAAFGGLRTNYLESLRTSDEMFGAEGRPIHALEKAETEEMGIGKARPPPWDREVNVTLKWVQSGIV